MPDTPPKFSQIDMLKEISGESKNIQTMANSLRAIRYVPTIFPSFNRALQLGGAPVNATYTIHGPPAGGKTALAIGIANSFVLQSHAAAYIEAEHALSKKWAARLRTRMDGILFNQPDNFEEAIDQVDKWISNFRKSKKAGNIPEDRAFCIVIDTIHKMPPKQELAKLRSENKSAGAENMNKGWGRYRANMITSWIDSLTPKVGKNDIAFLMLAHEREKARDDKESYWDDDYTVKGGRVLIEQAMVRLRVTAAEKLFDKKGNRKIFIGRKHLILVAKNKVGYPYDIANMYIGNGRGSMPLGFDLGQEAFEEAKSRNLLEQAGAYYTMPDGESLHGAPAAIQYLRENEDVYEDLFDLLNDTIEIRDNDDGNDEEDDTD